MQVKAQSIPMKFLDKPIVRVRDGRTRYGLPRESRGKGGGGRDARGEERKTEMHFALLVFDDLDGHCWEVFITKSWCEKNIR